MCEMFIRKLVERTNKYLVSRWVYKASLRATIWNVSDLLKFTMGLFLRFSRRVSHALGQ